MTDCCKTDQELIEEVKNGSDQSFEAIYMRYVEQIHRYVYYMLRKQESARDVTQEVFLKVYRHAALYRPIGKFSSWLYRIARNTTLKHIKRNRDLQSGLSLDVPREEFAANQGTAAEETTTEKSPLRTAVSKEEHAMLESGLLKLKPKERQILILCDINELAHKEAAQIVGCSLTSLDVQLHRIRLKLASLVGTSHA